MFSSYLTIWWRSLRRYPAFSLTHLAGLSCSITASLFLLGYVLDEWQYDRHHTQPDQLYRLAMDVSFGEEQRQVAVTPAPLGAALGARASAISQFASIRPFRGMQLRQEGELYPLSNTYFADAAIFELFAYEWLLGSPEQALNSPEAIVLTEQVAERLFGSTHAGLLGAIIETGGVDLQLRGIIKNPPAQSHFHPNAFLGYANPEMLRDWGNWNWYTYLRLQPGQSPEAVDPTLQAIYEQNLAPGIAEMGGGGIDFIWQQVPDIHFSSKRDFELEPNEGSYQYLLAFIITGLLLLLMAAINYATLGLARSGTRAREAGIRKVLGSHRKALLLQYMAESLAYSGLALLLSVCLFGLALPMFEYFTGKYINFAQLLEWRWLVGYGLIIFLLTLSASAYSALFLSGLNPLTALKSRGLYLRLHGLPLRRVLLTVQLSITLFLSISILVINQQLHYMSSEEPGYEASGLLSLQTGPLDGGEITALRQTLLAAPGIELVSSSTQLPGAAPQVNTFELATAKGPVRHILPQLWVDAYYLPALQIPLVAGTNFSPRQPEDSSLAGVIINERAAQLMGYSPAEVLGKRLSSEAWSDQVIGVVADFHQVSLHSAIEPLVIRYAPAGRQLLLRYRGEASSAMYSLNTGYEQALGYAAPQSSLLSDQLKYLYAADALRAELMNLFTLLTLFIALLGLAGLASFQVEQRKREVAIRKIQGAAAGHLLRLLNRDYLLLCFFATLIVAPLAWYGLQQYLSDFAYHINLAWWHLCIPALLVSSLAVLVVSVRSLQLLRLNPAEHLRHE